MYARLQKNNASGKNKKNRSRNFQSKNNTRPMTVNYYTQVPKNKPKTPIKRNKGKGAQKKKNQRKALNNLKVVAADTKTQPLQYFVPVDLISYIGLVEALMAILFKNCDIASDTDLGNWYHYFYYILSIHISRVGILQGSESLNLPRSPENCELKVPYSIAKHLEGLGTYNKTVKLQSTLTVNTNYTTPAGVLFGDSFGSNVGSTAYPRTGLNPWSFGNQQAVTSSVASGGGTFSQPYNAGLFFTPLGTDAGLTAFAANYLLINKMSAYISSNTPCVSLKDIPTHAPDSSAYGSLLLTPNLSVNPQPGAAFNYTMDFDSEITLMYSVSRSNVVVNSVFSKPISMPLEVLGGTVLPVPYYSQLWATLAFLGHNMNTKRYRAGTHKSTMTYQGHALRTFYRTRTYVNSLSFTQNILAIHKAMTSNKSNSDTDAGTLDTTGTYLWFTTAVCQYAFQYWFNQGDADCLSVPLIENSSSVFNILPQLSYAEGCWASVNLPPLIALIIESHAPVIVGGVMRTLAADYNDGVLTLGTGSSLTVPGPIGYCMGGWQPAVQNHYTVSTFYTTSFNQPQSDDASEFPSIAIVNQNEAKLNIDDTDFLPNFVGYHSNGTFFSLVLSGSFADVVIQEFDGWWKQDMLTNVPPRIQVTKAHFGTSPAMTHFLNWNPINATTITNNIATGVPSPVAQGDAVNAYGEAISSVVSAFPISPFESLQTVIVNNTDAAHKGKTGTLALRARRVTAMLSYYAGITPVAFSETDGPNVINIPSGSSTPSIFKNLAQMFTEPNTPFADALRKFTNDMPSTLPPGVLGPKPTDLVSKYLSAAATNLFSNVKANPQEAFNDLPSDMKKYGAALAPMISKFLGTRGFATAEVQNTAPKKKGLRKLFDKAVDIGKKTVGVIKTVADVAKTVEGVVAMF